MNEAEAKELLNTLKKKATEWREVAQSDFDGKMLVYNSLINVVRDSIRKNEVHLLASKLMIQLHGMNTQFRQHIKLGIADEDTQLSIQTIKECERELEKYYQTHKE